MGVGLCHQDQKIGDYPFRPRKLLCSKLMSAPKKDPFQKKQSFYTASVISALPPSPLRLNNLPSRKIGQQSTTYPLIYSLAGFISGRGIAPRALIQLHSMRLLNPHGTPRRAVCLQYLEKLKTDGHKKIKKITCDPAGFKKDYLKKLEYTFQLD